MRVSTAATVCGLNGACVTNRQLIVQVRAEQNAMKYSTTGTQFEIFEFEFEIFEFKIVIFKFEIVIFKIEIVIDN